jgi:hypothetical protein
MAHTQRITRNTLRFWLIVGLALAALWWNSRSPAIDYDRANQFMQMEQEQDAVTGFVNRQGWRP